MSKIIDTKEERFGPKGIIVRRAFLELLKDNLPAARQLYHSVPDDEKESLDYYMLEGELMFIDDNMRGAETAYMKAALLSEDNEEIIDRAFAGAGSRLSHRKIALGIYPFRNWK